MGAVRSFGGFELHEKIGSGGMATVYRGLQKSLDRPVVLKILHPHLSEDESLIARFEREAHAAANLRHENIVQVIDCGRQDDTSYIAMEYVEGLDLKKLQVFHGAPPLDIGLLLIRDICRGLRHAHDHGVVHRDIKPANLMLTTDGMIKIMDFGLARRGEDSVGMTATGAVMGTPAYMSPEQARGQIVDARSDLFSLGVVAYEMWTGARPFPGDTYTVVIQEILNTDPERVDIVNPDIPAEAADLAASMLRKDREQRCPSAAHALEVLETLAERRGLSRSRELLRRYATVWGGAAEAKTPADSPPSGVTVADPQATKIGPGAEAPVTTPSRKGEELKTRVEAPDAPARGAAPPGPPRGNPAPRAEPPSPPFDAPTVKKKRPLLLMAGGGIAIAAVVVVAVLVTRPKAPEPPEPPVKRENTGPLFGGADTSRGDGEENSGAGGNVRTGAGGDLQTGTGGEVKTGTGTDVKTGTGTHVKTGAGTGVKTGRGSDANTDAGGRITASRKYQISTKPYGFLYLDGNPVPIIGEPWRPVTKTLSVGPHTFRGVNVGLGIDITGTYSVESTDRNNKLIFNLKTGQVEAKYGPDLPF